LREEEMLSSDVDLERLVAVLAVLSWAVWGWYRGRVKR